VRIKKRNFAAG